MLSSHEVTVDNRMLARGAREETTPATVSRRTKPSLTVSSLEKEQAQEHTNVVATLQLHPQAVRCTIALNARGGDLVVRQLIRVDADCDSAQRQA